MPATFAIFSIDPFSNPEAQKTFRADSTIVLTRCFFGGRRASLRATIVNVKLACCWVFEYFQYVTKVSQLQFLLKTSCCNKVSFMLRSAINGDIVLRS